jgi:PEP-CTERM motif
MKNRILSSLCAVAVMAYATLSWGASVFVENQAENFLMTNAGGTITLGATNSATRDTATVNGTTVIDSQIGPNAASQLGTIVTGNTLIQGNSTVAEGSSSIAPVAPSVDVYALAAGIVSIDPFATANPILPNHASLQSVATFYQDFTTTGVTSLVLSGRFRPFWQGDGDSWKSQWRGVFTVLDVTGATVLGTIDTGWVAFLAADNGNNNLLSPFTLTFAPVAGNIYAFAADAYINAADPVPEPSTFVLAGSGILGLFFMRRRSRKA